MDLPGKVEIRPMVITPVTPPYKVAVPPAIKVEAVGGTPIFTSAIDRERPVLAIAAHSMEIVEHLEAIINGVRANVKEQVVDAFKKLIGELHGISNIAVLPYATTSAIFDLKSKIIVKSADYNYMSDRHEEF